MERPISRNVARLAVASLAAVTVLVWGRPAAPQPAPAPGSPIKVGLILPGTGPFTVNAQRITRGVRVFFRSKDRQVAGRKIELLTEDDQGEPQVSLTKAQKLVERDRIHALMSF